jgi:hypothetical protein
MVPSNVYADLTRAFNAGRTRAVLCGGQAVVLHRLAVTSKDGDWTIREDDEAVRHILGVLSDRGARYRFGAPLDVRWLRGGWSAHLEFVEGPLRVRCDFFSRPPRIDAADLARIWAAAEGRDVPFADAVSLAEMKKTDREKDYPVIGELARRTGSVEAEMLLSRSALDLIRLKREHPDTARALSARRPLLAQIGEDRRTAAAALDAEKLDLILANEERLAKFASAAQRWRDAWPDLDARLAGQPLPAAHAAVLAAARGVLPESPDAD